MALRTLALIEPLIVDHALADRLHVGVRGPLGLGVHQRPGHLVLGIEVVPFVAGNEREVRADERDEEHPWLAGRLARALLEPGLGGRGDALVVILVGGVAPARIGSELESSLAHGQRIAQQAQRIADSLDDVQRHVLLREAVVDRGALQVQLADRVRRDGRPPADGAPMSACCRRRRWRCPRSGSGGRSARYESLRARARRSASCSRRP